MSSQERPYRPPAGLAFEKVPRKFQGLFRRDPNRLGAYDYATVIRDSNEAAVEAYPVQQNITFTDKYYAAKSVRIADHLAGLRAITGITPEVRTDVKNNIFELENKLAIVAHDQAFSTRTIAKHTITESIDPQFLEVINTIDRAREEGKLPRDYDVVAATLPPLQLRNAEYARLQDEGAYITSVSISDQRAISFSLSFETDTVTVHLPNDFNPARSTVVPGPDAVTEILGGPLTREDQRSIADELITHPFTSEICAAYIHALEDYLRNSEVARPDPVIIRRTEEAERRLITFFGGRDPYVVNLSDIPLYALNATAALNVHGPNIPEEETPQPFL